MCKMKSTFYSDILTSRSNSVYHGYQETFPEYVSSMKSEVSAVAPSGTINVYPDVTAVI